jgi:hypothetical protein
MYISRIEILIFFLGLLALFEDTTATNPTSLEIKAQVA